MFAGNTACFAASFFFFFLNNPDADRLPDESLQAALQQHLVAQGGR